MQNLFSEFKTVSAADWKTQLMKDLKGEAFESLVWKNENGFDIQPFYTAEDVKEIYTPAFTHADWEITVSGKSKDAKTLNAQLLKQLNGGASSISVVLENSDPNIVLKDIQLNYIKSVFYLDVSNAVTFDNYLKKNYDLNSLHLTLLPEHCDTAAELDQWNKTIDRYKAFKNIKTAGFDGLYFHNQNCDAYYEVAVLMSGIIELLNTSKSDSDFVVKTGVNADYFVQIAKLRAVRRLWSLLKKEYNIDNNLYVIVETGLTNKSISDSYNNLLRTTVESMAAVSGGCNELIVGAFDTLFAVNNTLSERMAVNQQLILKDESYLDKMADIACGSYYIEHITDQLAEKALEKIKAFEKEGGYFVCVKKNIFATEIALQANEKSQQINDKAKTIIGVNKFKNEKENIQISAEQATQLKQLPANNPVLNFELENYFK